MKKLYLLLLCIPVFCYGHNDYTHHEDYDFIVIKDHKIRLWDSKIEFDRGFLSILYFRNSYLEENKKEIENLGVEVGTVYASSKLGYSRMQIDADEIDGLFIPETTEPNQYYDKQELIDKCK